MKLGKATGTVGKEIVHRHLQTLLAVLKLTQQLQLVAADHLCRRGRRRRAEIRDKIGDRNVRFVADGGNKRNFRIIDGSDDNFFVKRPEVFKTAAAAGDDDGQKSVSKPAQYYTYTPAETSEESCDE